MFSWICPQCGREVPPSKTECPDCTERAQQAAAAGLPTGTPPQAYPPQAYPPQAGQAPPSWAPPPPPAPVYQPPQAPLQTTQGFAPVQYQPQYPPPPGYPQHLAQHVPQQVAQPMAWPPPQRKAAPPTWLVGGGFALVLILLFGGIYYFMSRSDGPAAGSATKPATAGAAAKGVSNPLQRSIEVTGLRFTTANKSPAVKFVVINHSGSVVVDLMGTVTLWAGTSRSDEDAIGTFNLNVDTVEAGGVKEITAPLKTKLKAYEMPDWQNATAEVQISSPAP